MHSGTSQFGPVTLARWQRLCDALHLTSGNGEYRKLIRSWKSWGRHYHTIEHLTACLREFDEVRDLCEHPSEVELALWFHDAIYRPYRTDNEIKSAEWASRFLADHGAEADAVDRVSNLVLATRHGADVLQGDAALTVDVDLSILGQPTEIYSAFERNVRKEYRWVPKRRYAAARTGILQSFLARPSIYFLSSFRERYEARARANLEDAIKALAAR